MIETDEQRRWWFATHPEYSWSHKGEKNREEGQEKGDADKVRPEDVDAYVDNALKYVDGPVADLLRSVKRNFGTEADLLNQWQNVLDAWAHGGGETRASFAQYAPDGGAFMPRLPTIDELSRWPGELARQFLSWLNALWESNNIIWDPNAPHNHHRLVKKLTTYFMDCGLEVDMYLRIMKAGDHMALHSGEGRGGDWCREWEKFADTWPPKKSKKHHDRIMAQL